MGSKGPRKSNRGRKREPVRNKVDLKHVEDLAAAGLTNEQLAVALKKSRRTIYNWIGDQEFSAHLRKGQKKANARVAGSLFSRAVGIQMFEETYEPVVVERQVDGAKQKVLLSTKLALTKRVSKFIPPDVTACMDWLTNKDRENWKHRQTHEFDPAHPPIANVTFRVIGSADAK